MSKRVSPEPVPADGKRAWSRSARTDTPSSSPDPSPAQLRRSAGGGDETPIEAANELQGVEHPIPSPSLTDEQVYEQLKVDAVFLAENGKDPTFSLLHFVALLGHGALSAALEVAASKDNGAVVLDRYACLAQALLRLGHPAHVVDKFYCTPLQIASALGNVRMISALLAAPAPTAQHQQPRRAWSLPGGVVSLAATGILGGGGVVDVTSRIGPRLPALNASAAANSNSTAGTGHWRPQPLSEAPSRVRDGTAADFARAEAVRGRGNALLAHVNHQDRQIRFTALHAAMSHSQHAAAVALLQAGANPQLLDLTLRNAFQVAPSMDALKQFFDHVVANEASVTTVPTSAIVLLLTEVIAEFNLHSYYFTQRTATTGGAPAAAAAVATAALAVNVPPAAPPSPSHAAPSPASRSASVDGRGGSITASSAYARQGSTTAAAAAAGSGADAATLPAAPAVAAVAPVIALASADQQQQASNEYLRMRLDALFGKLYNQQKYHDIWHYVQAAIQYSHHRLTQLTLDIICTSCPKVLAQPDWEGLLMPLAASFSDLFRGFVKRLQTTLTQGEIIAFVRTQDYCTPLLGDSSAARQPGAGSGGSAYEGMEAIHAASAAAQASERKVRRVAFYQQLVGGLSEAGYTVIKAFLEHTPQEVLDDMAQDPVFQDFVMLIADKEAGPHTDPAGSQRPAGGAAAPLAGGPADTGALVAVLELSRQGLHDAGPTAKAGGSQQQLDCVPPTYCILDVAPMLQAAVRAGGSTNVDAAITGIVEFLLCNYIVVSGGDAAASSAAPMPKRQTVYVTGVNGALLRDLAKMHAASTAKLLGALGQAVQHGPTALQVASVLLYATARRKQQAVKASSVSSQSVAWHNAELMYLQTRHNFTSEAVDMLVASGMPLECAFKAAKQSQLATSPHTFAQRLAAGQYMAAANSVFGVGGGGDSRKGGVAFGAANSGAGAGRGAADCAEFDVVAAGGLITTNCTQSLLERLIFLIKAGLDVEELATLIANDTDLRRVEALVRTCAEPPPPSTDEAATYALERHLHKQNHSQGQGRGAASAAAAARGSGGGGSNEGIAEERRQQLKEAWGGKVDPMVVLLKDMIREKLPYDVIDTILLSGPMHDATAVMFQPGTTLYNVYRPLLLGDEYGPWFVQMLLTKWKRGQKDGKGDWTMNPWDLRYINTTFASNDPLSLNLKAAYNKKLRAVQVTLSADSTAQDEWCATKDREVRQALDAFVSYWGLIHRWPTYLLASSMLPVVQALLGNRVSNRAVASQQALVDAKSLVLPLLHLPSLGKGQDLLTALVKAKAPAVWYAFPSVRALHELHWGSFGKMTAILGFLVHVQHAACFLAFFIILLNLRRDEADDSQRIATHDLRSSNAALGLLGTSAVLSVSMLSELVLDWWFTGGGSPLRMLTGTWVQFGQQTELWGHALVLTAAALVWADGEFAIIATISGFAMMVMTLRLVLFALATDRLCQSVLALLEIISDSKYFFLLMGVIYAGALLAFSGLRGYGGLDVPAYATKLFTVLIGDLSSGDLFENSDATWRFQGVAAVLLALYCVAMLIIFMNLLIATMNDTYDRVKEFQEVEMMRLRAHMMRSMKALMTPNTLKGLAACSGRFLHVLVPGNIALEQHPWFAPGAGEADPTEWSAWAGRIAYMRKTMVRDVDASLEPRMAALRDGLDRRLCGMEEQLQRLVEVAAAMPAPILPIRKQ